MSNIVLRLIIIMPIFRINIIKNKLFITLKSLKMTTFFTFLKFLPLRRAEKNHLRITSAEPAAFGCNELLKTRFHGSYCGTWVFA